MLAENKRVADALRASAPDFGELMVRSHDRLREDFDVVAPAVDRLVAVLRQQTGVFGARMTGAGFGGACVALVEAGRAREIGTYIVASAGVPDASVLVSPVLA